MVGLKEELLKSIWHAFTALDLDRSGKVSKSQLKASGAAGPGAARREGWRAQGRGVGRGSVWERGLAGLAAVGSGAGHGPRGCRAWGRSEVATLRAG